MLKTEHQIIENMKQERKGENNHDHSSPPIRYRSCGFDSGNGEWSDQGARKSRGINGSKRLVTMKPTKPKTIIRRNGGKAEWKHLKLMWGGGSWTYMWRYKWLTALALAFTFLTSLLLTAIPLAARWYIDHLVDPKAGSPVMTAFQFSFSTMGYSLGACWQPTWAS